MEPQITETVALTGDTLVECRVLFSRVRAAKERLGDADFVVASAELRRNQARMDAARELQELEALATREAKKLGIDLTSNAWRFNPETGEFARP